MHLDEHVAGELDLAQHVCHRLGMEDTQAMPRATIACHSPLSTPSYGVGTTVTSNVLLLTRLPLLPLQPP